MGNSDQHSTRRPGVIGVHSIDRFVFSVPSLDDAERFYMAFGLAVRRSGNTLELRTFGNPHCWGVVHATGAQKKLEYVSYGVFADDLERFEARVAKAGIRAAPNSLSDGKGLWLTDPDGVAVQLLAAPKVTPITKPTLNAPSAPARGQAAAPARSQVAQVRPRRL